MTAKELTFGKLIDSIQLYRTYSQIVRSVTAQSQFLQEQTKELDGSS